MTKALIQITIDVEYEQVHLDSDQHLKTIVTNLNDEVHQAVASGMLRPPMSDEYDVKTWEVDVKILNPEKAKAQFQAERISSASHVTAFFSSDGPAVSVEIPDADPPDHGLTLLISDINGACREAFHKYRAYLREGS